MDHSLFNFTGRAELTKLLTAQVLEKLRSGVRTS